jgi:hypothetical protein
MQSPIPHVRIVLVGNECIGKRSLLESFLTHLPTAPPIPLPGCYKETQILDNVPDALFDSAEVSNLRVQGVRAGPAARLRLVTIQGFTSDELWGGEDPWGPRAIWDDSLSQEKLCELVGAHVVGICFSIGDHRALDGVRDKVHAMTTSSHLNI